MLESHNKILPLESVHYSPFYDQATIINRATNECIEVGATELVPPLLEMEFKSPNILNPEFRTDLYIFSMIRQVYRDVPEASMIPTERRDMNICEFIELTHDKVFPQTAERCITRCDFRDISLFISACTDKGGEITNKELAFYLADAIQDMPSIEDYLGHELRFPEEEESDNGK